MEKLKELESPLRTAIGFLEKRGYRYTIIGGIAVSQWGFDRFTHDIDLKVLVPDTNYTKIRNEIRATFPDRARPNAPDNPLIVAVQIDGVTVDFLFTIPGYDELVIERSVQRDLGDFSIWICSLEDLIVQKFSADRGKDWEDIEVLVNAHYMELDKAYIENWIAQFAEALEKPELLTEYHRLLAKAKSQSA